MDEQQLIAGLKDRNAAAVQNLVESYGDRLLRSAYLLCGNKAEAEDLVQETFLQAFKSIHRFRSQSSLYIWLNSILINLARHYHRKRQRMVCDDALARQDAPQAEAEGMGFDHQAASSALSQAMGSLSHVHREVLTLRFFEAMKINEIALQLGLSTGTVKSRLHYAIAEMQTLLPGELNLFGSAGTNQKTGAK